MELFVFQGDPIMLLATSGGAITQQVESSQGTDIF